MRLTRNTKKTTELKGEDRRFTLLGTEIEKRVLWVDEEELPWENLPKS